MAYRIAILLLVLLTGTFLLWTCAVGAHPVLQGIAFVIESTLLAWLLSGRSRS